MHDAAGQYSNRSQTGHTHLASCTTFLSYHILTPSLFYYFTNPRQHGIYLSISLSLKNTHVVLWDTEPEILSVWQTSRK